MHMVDVRIAEVGVLGADAQGRERIDEQVHVEPLQRRTDLRGVAEQVRVVAFQVLVIA